MIELLIILFLYVCTGVILYKMFPVTGIWASTWILQVIGGIVVWVGLMIVWGLNDLYFTYKQYRWRKKQ